MRRDPGPFALRFVAIWLLGAVVALTAQAAPPPARPLLSPVFADGMVLQRGKPNPIWGWTDPGAVVRVSVNGITAEGRAGEDGKWTATIAPPPPGGPYEVTVEGPQRIVLQDVLVGDVWLCSGQSNMAMTLGRARNGAEEAKAADLPRIRLFALSQRSAYAPVDFPLGEWRTCTPEAAPAFPAIAFFFARRLQHELGIPIGVIHAAVGGGPVESWLSGDGLASTGEFLPQIAEIARLHRQGAPELGSFLMHWLAEHDIGGRDDAWARPALADDDWQPVELPAAFATLDVATTPAVVWFRREIQLPDPLPPGNARLLLGQVGKMDTAYLNGRWVGASSWVENPRSYPISPDILKPGRNVLAVRVFKLASRGGFLDGPDALRLQFGTSDHGTTIPLGTGWKAKLSVDARPPHPFPLDLENYPTMPVVLYNGMIHPLAPLAMSGALWYQGEANFTRAGQYRKLLTALITDWRRTFRNADLPVYVVSLPAFMTRRDTPGSDGWTEVRDAQIQTARSVPGAGVVVTVDVGDANNIHPVDKQPVGERLAALALAQLHGRNVPHHGPTFRAVEQLPGALRLTFDHTDGGLEVRGEKPGEFAVAGEDRVWHWADAVLEDDTIVVSSRAVPRPVAARYAWQANPMATLFNGAGLPAVPFRTDDWPLQEK